MSLSSETSITKCLIYCRVSSQRQVVEGHGLESQEQRCRQLANELNIKVAEVFPDEGISGGLFDRPAMKRLIQFLDDHPTERYYIIFDDISRFARDVKTHLLLKAELISRGAILKCLNFNFEDSPEGEFAENITAASAQYDRQKNRRQVVQKMKARLEKGCWCFRSPPLGLSYFKDLIHGKILKAVQPYSVIYKEAIESYDNGLFNTLEETRAFIESKYKEYGIKRPTSISGTRAILSELLYTGYMEYPKWEIKRMKGEHEGFINIETYNRVQDKLKGKSKIAARKDYNLDFPLRTLVLCDECKKSYTAAWVHGRNAKYPKYWCKNKNCLLYAKSVPRDIIEGQFKLVLEHSKPASEVVDLTRDVLLNAWENKTANYKANRERIERRIAEIDKQVSGLSNQVALKLTTSDQEIIKIYEEQIRKLAKEQESLKSALASPTYTTGQFRTATDKVMGVLKEPVAMWESKEYKDKVTIFAMYYDEKLSYNLKEGFRTATLALPVALMKESEVQKNTLVEMPGVEPGSEKTLCKKV